LIFNSATFLIFLAGFVALWWRLDQRPRQWLIFIGSLAFYGFWRIDFISILLLSVTTDFFVALALARSESNRRRRFILAISLLLNLGLLAYFKYADFILANGLALAGLFGVRLDHGPLDIILPLGISFYTFQSVSYTIDVYRRDIPAERDYLSFANFVLFFPQLVAGPILRASEVLEQLKGRERFQLANLSVGLQLILVGLFFKVVLADNIAPLVDEGYGLPASAMGAKEAWALASLFGYQIYFDFAGYSSIAIGCARLMGIHFPENFNWPYLSSSPREFWKRWHISLSSWIRDYLYAPLSNLNPRHHSTGGLGSLPVDQPSRAATALRRTPALFATWAIMGLWHGANWTFVCWGVWHALLVFAYRLISPRLTLPHVVGIICGWIATYPLVMLGWIFFRAQSTADAFHLISRTLLLESYSAPFALPRHYYTLSLLLPLGMLAAYAASRAWPALRRRPVAGGALHLAGLTAMVALVFVYLRPIRQFIYFQF
jgi:D-alanyl-lipoteichoic acid acyltransferase DltB (MBOAT superfamily)